MKVRFNPSALKRQSWPEYALRFLFGGLATALIGLMGRNCGPEFGGLFLAFPVLLPLTLTLVEKRQKQSKERVGLDGAKRARCAASVESRGAAMGGVGLLAFAAVAWRLLPEQEPWLVVAAATLAWLGVSIVFWRVRRMTAHAILASKDKP